MQDERFARHRLIEGFSQEKVAALTIGLIGAGAIGNEILKNLLLLGAGQVDVYDFDTVEESNLTRSIFLRTTDIGNNKAQAVVARAQEVHPATVLKAIPGDITRTLSLTRAAQYDVLIAAVDNFEARLRLNEIARLTNRPLLNLAIDHRHAVCEWFGTAADDACYACHLPDSAYERIAKRYSCAGLRRAAFIERKIPTTTITASWVAALGMAQIFQLVQERPQPMRSKRLFGDTIAGNLQTMSLAHNPDCPCCGEAGLFARTKSWRVISQPGCSGAEIAALTNNPDAIAVFSDAIISQARCVNAASRGCGYERADVIGQRMRDVSDDLVDCPVCMDQTVAVESIESTPISELGVITFTEHSPAWVCVDDWVIDRAKSAATKE